MAEQGDVQIGGRCILNGSPQQEANSHSYQRQLEQQNLHIESISRRAGA